MTSYSVFVPCFNEEDNIVPIYERLCKVLEPEGDFEILYIDDGSTDNTLKCVKELSQKDSRVKFISFSKNFGLEPGTRAGFKYASMHWTVQIDADLQSRPEDISLLIMKVKEGYDAAFAIRRGRKDGLVKILGSMGQHFISRHLFRIHMPKNASTFRIIDSRVAKKIIHYSDSPYLYFMPEAVAVGMTYAFVEVPHVARERGESKFKLPLSLTSTKDLFLGHSLMPLNYFWILVPLLALLAFLPSHPAALVSILFAFGLWLQSIYVGRCAKTLSHKYSYLIREANIELDPKDDLYEFASKSSLNLRK